MQSVGKNMTAGSPLKLILALSLPLMVANAFQQLYTVADTAIVGSVLGLGALAALGAVDEGDTLVFDEVDAGVGGSVALALADVLADLAETHQVIVVTHLAQVAVRAQMHYLVSKNVAEDGSIPETTLTELDEEGRVLEVARMLSGNSSEASCAHAKEMLGMA